MTHAATNPFRAGTTLRIVGALGLLALPRAASASEVFAQLSFDTHALWFPRMPATATIGPVMSDLRTTQTGDVPVGGSGVFAGATSQLTLAIHDRWLVPITGMQFAGAVGSSSGSIGSIDGSTVETQPWNAGYFGLLLPGFGARYRNLHFLFQARVYTGLSFMWMNASVQIANSTMDTSILTTSFLVRLDVEACYRMDPSRGVCIFAAPNLYEYGALNGGMVGLRLEIGP